MAFLDDDLQDVEPIRLIGEPAAGGSVRKNLTNGRAFIGIARRKLRNGIVERDAPLIHAAQHERRGQGLRQAVGVKRCIGAGRYQPFDVLVAEHPFVGHVGGADDHQRHTGDADLDAQCFDVVAEAREDQVIGGVQWHTDNERGGESGGSS